MKFRRNVTVFVRKNRGNDTFWEKHLIRNALFTEVKSANSNISVRGFVPNSSITVRFPVQKAFSLKPGDRLFSGQAEGDFPPADAFSVLSVTGGDRGARTIRLIKAVCG